jgi:ketosteroid isomerase-like protein
MAALGSDEADEIKSLACVHAAREDRQQASALADLYTEDGIWDASPVGLPCLQGRDALIAGFEARFADIPITFQLVANQLVWIDGPDAAGGSCCVVGWAVSIDGDRVEVLRVCDDRYLRTDDGWRLHSRVVSPAMWGATTGE